MKKEKFIKLLNSKYLFIVLLLFLAILFTFIYFSNKSFFLPEDELKNPVIILVENQTIRLNNILYLQELLSIKEGRNVTNREAMEILINEEIFYVKALENGFNLTDKEVKNTINENLNKDEFAYYKKYYIIDRYKTNLIEENKEKFEVTKEEAQDLFEFMKVNYPRNDYPPFEELELSLKDALSRQKVANFLDEFVSNLRNTLKINYLKTYILDNRSSYYSEIESEGFSEIINQNGN